MASAVLDPPRSVDQVRWRVRASPLVAAIGLGLLATFASLLALAAVRGLWLTDLKGFPAARDFAGFWAAGREAQRGRAAFGYDWPELAHVLRAAGGAAPQTAFPFFYPPVFLLILAPLGALPFLAAAWLWTGGVYAAFLAMLSRITHRRELIVLGAAAPAAFCCLAVGQNGLLSAALIGAALAVVDRRPLLAGVLIGAVAYKPQLGLLFPVALIVSRRWRTLASAACTVAGLVALSLAAFGRAPWARFIHGAGHAGSAALNGAPDKLQSVYGLMLAADAPGRSSWAIQGAAGLFAIAFVAWLWRRPRAAGLQAAGLSACVLLATPYSFIYDAPILIPAVLLLAADRKRWPVAHQVLLALAYLAPLAFMARAFPVLPLACAALCGVVTLRALGHATPAEPALLAEA